MRRYERVPEDDEASTERTERTTDPWPAAAGRCQTWWCPTCQAERGRDVVRLVIVGSDARRVCWGCQTVLEHEAIPF